MDDWIGGQTNELMHERSDASICKLEITRFEW